MPWAASRNGTGSRSQDHLHVLVTMVRENAGRVSTSNDYRALSATCRRMEQGYGVTVVEGRTAGAAQGPVEGELELSRRTGRSRTGSTWRTAFGPQRPHQLTKANSCVACGPVGSWCGHGLPERIR